jgi:hypothetical protein
MFLPPQELAKRAHVPWDYLYSGPLFMPFNTKTHTTKTSSRPPPKQFLHPRDWRFVMLNCFTALPFCFVIILFALLQPRHKISSLGTSLHALQHQTNHEEDITAPTTNTIPTSTRLALYHAAMCFTAMPFCFAMLRCALLQAAPQAPRLLRDKPLVSPANRHAAFTTLGSSDPPSWIVRVWQQ